MQTDGCKKIQGPILPSATLHLVGWVEPVAGYVGFLRRRTNLEFVSSIAYCETQQWPVLEPSSRITIPASSINPDTSEMSYLRSQIQMAWVLQPYVDRSPDVAGKPAYWISTLQTANAFGAPGSDVGNTGCDFIIHLGRFHLNSQTAHLIRMELPI